MMTWPGKFRDGPLGGNYSEVRLSVTFSIWVGGWDGSHGMGHMGWVTWDGSQVHPPLNLPNSNGMAFLVMSQV